MEMKYQHEACKPQQQEHLYRIGMFAAMNHVTVKALRYYEEQGLLVPAYINQENGYRYYTMGQMAIVHQITALKKAGFLLDEIVAIQKGVDEKALLLKKKEKLLEKIAELTRQTAVIDGYLSKKKIALATPVLVKQIPETTVAAIQGRIESYDCLFDMMPKMGELMEQAGCTCAVPEYCFTNYLEAGYKEGDIMVEICEAVSEPKCELGGLYYKKFPSVLAACIYHKGSYATLPETYEAALKFIEENGYEIDGEIRECYIDGVWNKEDESEWLSEIQIPIRK